MLISFSVENYLSFYSPTTFSMVSGKKALTKNRNVNLKQYKTKVLPVSAIYGANASGKTNFCKALAFIKLFVTKGISNNPKQFLLDPQAKAKPSCFSLEFLVDQIIYEFSFKVKQNNILEEKLVKINQDSEIILYHRQNNQIQLDDSLPKEEKEHLNFIFKSTRSNLLFLYNTYSLNNKSFLPIFNWFQNTLRVVGLDFTGETIIPMLENKEDLVNELLLDLDTGISNFILEEVPSFNLPPLMLEEGKTVGFVSQTPGMFITNVGGKLVSRQLLTRHKTIDGGNKDFELTLESSGTNRLISLFQVILNLIHNFENKVYIIDELDSSWHSLLTEAILEKYLNNFNEKSRSQLIFTTHNTTLMDSDLFEQDELWVTEKEFNGATNIYSFSDFSDFSKLKSKSIGKSYLEGRLGGVPNIV